MTAGPAVAPFGTPPGPGQPYRRGGRAELPRPERTRQLIGLALYVVGMLVGAALLILLFVLFPFAAGVGVETLMATLIGAALAFPAALVYLTVPRLLDRYDPEPAYALVMALLWGGVAACGVSALVNTIVGLLFGDIASAVISAPIVEEGMKGLLIFGFFYFLRREFDGVVDGIIYATFVAIGFAAVENVIYYARAGLEPQGNVAVVFFLRGGLTPWAHPLFTAMIGIGFGVARETSRPWLRWLAPPIGYAAAVFLHAVWNGSATLVGGSVTGGLLFLFVMLPLWFVFVGAFLIMVIVLVRRRGKIIRENLVDEVALGHLTEQEVRLVGSAFGGLRAYFSRGADGVEFVRTVARLSLSKWHTQRAMKGKTRTVSMEFIAPLRQRIREIRQRGGAPPA